MDWAKTTARRDEKYFVLGFGVAYIRGLMVVLMVNQVFVSILKQVLYLYYNYCIVNDEASFI